jgi:hypothetical protein
MSLRSNSQSKKQQTAAPGVIQPLPQQRRAAKPQTQQQHKLKTSLRGDRDGPMSPTHSAMRLPHIPGPGSSASSIRSFQTDLSSIAEDHPLDHLSPNTKGSSHLYPMRSAMKGGSGPPSIISEAVSEESRSSLGAHDRKGKARVSFSDAEPDPPQIMNLGSKKGNNGLLKPENAAILGRPVSLPASPPLSPPLSPRVPTQVPPVLPGAKNTTKNTVNSTDAATQQWVSTTSQQTTLPFELNSLPQTAGTTIPSQPLDVEPIPTLTAAKATVLQAKQSIPQTNHIPQVTIHVPSTPSSRPKSKLPGSFPDPTPEPTPPSTAESQFTDAQEKYDTIAPAPRNKQLSQVANVDNDLDLQRGLSLRTLSLVPTKPGVTSSSNLAVTGGEDMARRRSSESAGSGVSIYSDAVDDLSAEQKKEARDAAQETRNNTQVNGSSIQGRPTSPKEARQIRPSSPKVAKAADSTVQERPTSKEMAVAGVAAAAVAAIATKSTTTKPATKKAAATKSTAVSKAAETTKPAGPTKAASATNLTVVTKPPTSPSTGTTIPIGSPVKSSQNGIVAPVNSVPAKSAPMKSSLRSSSVPPTSPTSPPRERKPMRTSMRADRTTSATSADMARGLMSLPRIERVPSDSSFKRLKPRGNRDESVARTTLRGPVVAPEREPARTTLRKGRRDSDSSDEIMMGGRGRASSFLGRFRRRESSIDQPLSTTRGPIVGSRFDDSSDDDDELVPPARGIGRAYEDTESLPPASPTVKKRSSFSQMFRRSNARPTSKGSVTAPVVPTIATTTTPLPAPLPATAVANDIDGEAGGHRRTKSVSGSIVSKRTGKEKRFQGLRKLFRIKE